MTSAAVLCLTLLQTAAGPAEMPWQRGLELTYSGSVTEQQERPASRFRRAHDLTVRVLVLERRETWADVAVLTALRRTDDAVSTAVGSVTGGEPGKRESPPLTRLDLLRIHENGTTHLLQPTGTPPLLLVKDTPVRAVPVAPLDTYSPFEFGLFPPHSRGEGAAWSLVSSNPELPAEQWHHHPAEFVNAVHCARLQMTQRAADWDKPQAGRTSWQRVESVWISAQDQIVRQVYREIVQRDGLDPAPAVRVEAKYSLQSRAHIIGKGYDRSRTDIELAFAVGRDLDLQLGDPQRFDGKWVEGRVARLKQYLLDSEPGSPYREAVQGVLRRLESARRGDPIP